jgi:ribonucleoside-triphosphate reductase (thioredoxin)
MTSNLLPTDYQSFIHTSRYARWLEEENRRENWAETVERYVTNLVEGKVDQQTTSDIQQAILGLDVMPSMRAVMTAGPALERDNTAGYNCSYLPVDDPKSFDEAMFILLCGTGVGFSVERQYISKLPEVPENLFISQDVISVHDSKEGWAKALRKLIAMLYSGEIPEFDTSKVRPAGAKLKTFGGRASGPAPLIDLFNFVIGVFNRAKGRKLSSIECHDIMCKIGEVVVVGGVRRSAMISLSDLDNEALALAKSSDFLVDQYSLVAEDDTSWTYTLTMKKNLAVRPTYKVTLYKGASKNDWDQHRLEFEKKIGWWVVEPQRALANNSVAYVEKPNTVSFMREWTSLVESGSGERGIFNRQASKKQAAKNGRRDANHEFGTNPCSEIILRPYQFCNLTEVVVRATDSLEDLKRKVRIATILGTIQSTYTHFPYLRKIWQKNTEEERLLGVSLTGIMDNPLMTTKNAGLEKTLEVLKDVAVNTNAEWAERLGIPVSAAITCNKPSGTVSQLVDSASGIHARHSPYYIRTVRGDNKDPLTQFMKDQGIPNEPDVMKPTQTTVFSFPMKAPEGAVVTAGLTAIEQLEMWLAYQRNWCEHKPSVTINVKNDEWFEVGAFVYKHFDEMSGVSFLPYSNHTYKQAPYQEINQREYEDFLSLMPTAIDWAKLSEYEAEDNTTGSQSFACSSGSCEIVDLT